MTTLTNVMKKLIDDLVVEKLDDCSEEFLATLNELIEKGTEISKKIQTLCSNTKLNGRRLTNASSSSDVCCVSDEMETVYLDSEDDLPQKSLSNDTPKTIKPTPAASQKKSSNRSRVKKRQLNLKSIDVNKFFVKQCVVKLKRENITDLLSTHGLALNVVSAKSASNTALEPNEQTKPSSAQVSFNEIESITDVDLNAVVELYPYEDYKKWYRNVCCLQ